MKKLLLFFIVLFAVSCNKDQTEYEFSDQDLTSFPFVFIDANGINLISTSDSYGIDFRTMNLSYIKNGIKEPLISNHFCHPNNLSLCCGRLSIIDSINTTCVVEIILSDSTILEFGSRYSDTIVREGLNKIIRYNGEIVWDELRDVGKYPIAIIKK